MYGVLPPTEEHSLTFTKRMMMMMMVMMMMVMMVIMMMMMIMMEPLRKQRFLWSVQYLAGAGGPPFCQCGALTFNWWCLTPMKGGVQRL